MYWIVISNLREIIIIIIWGSYERKISIKQLSELADVPYRTLYKIITKETKEPSVNIMIRIAKALNITTDNLIFGKDTKCDVNDLNHTEQKLLSDFRSLNKQGQEYILQTLDMAKDRYKKSDYISDLENIN